MLVKVDTLTFPTNFVVMDIEECEEVPLIIRRPFLKPSKMIIDMDKGRSNYKYKMRFGITSLEHSSSTTTSKDLLRDNI